MNQLPTQMTAAFIRRVGGPEVIDIGQLSVPTCGPTDVLVKVAALAVNHVDSYIRSGAYATELKMPFIIGRDLVGRVVATGERVMNFAIGDEATGLRGRIVVVP